jgi:HAD superfamily hydrolase (TIGR01662 family)
MSLRNLLDTPEVDLGDPSRFSVRSAMAAYTKPVIGISRDGIINQFRPDHVKVAGEFSPIEDALKAVALMRNKGHRIIIFASQWGISEGKMTPVDVDLVNQHMLNLLGEAGCTSIDGIYYSTSKQKDDIYAFPNVGMFQRAEREAKVKFSEGWFIGNTIPELKAAQNIKAKSVFIKTGQAEETEKKLNSYANQDLKRRVQTFNTLMEFAESL